jgi:hypothetical protein
LKLGILIPLLGIWNLGFGACHLDDVGGAVKMARGIG